MRVKRYRRLRRGEHIMALRCWWHANFGEKLPTLAKSMHSDFVGKPSPTSWLISDLPFFAAVNTRSVSATCGSKAIPLEKFLIPSFSVAASVCFPGSMSIFFGRVSVVGRITILRSCFQHKPVACRLSFWNQFWSKRKLFQHVATLIQ